MRKPIALVVTDVDGTLVTTDKSLTPATRAAVRRLGEAGIGFTVASSRPPVRPYGANAPESTLCQGVCHRL